MTRVFEFLLLGVLLRSHLGVAIECFHCAYIEASNDTSTECLNYNTTDISDCEDSTACIQLSYQNPENGGYVSFFLGCGTTECTDPDSYGVEQIEYNSSYNNYTLRKTCCADDYCNCNSSVCDGAVEAHKNLLPSEETTESPTLETTATDNEMVDCFRCAHIAPAGVISPECINHNTTQHVLCPGKTCLKLSQQYNNGTTDFIVYTLDCGQSKCTESISDGVERSAIIQNGSLVEKVTCCAGEYCNCDSQTCLDSINSSATPSVVVTTTTTLAPEETTMIEATTGAFTFPVTSDDYESTTTTLAPEETTMIEATTGEFTFPVTSVDYENTTFTDSVVTSPWTFPQETTVNEEENESSTSPHSTADMVSVTASSNSNTSKNSPDATNTTSGDAPTVRVDTKQTTTSQKVQTETTTGSASTIHLSIMWIVFIAFALAYPSCIH